MWTSCPFFRSKHRSNSIFLFLFNVKEVATCVIASLANSRLLECFLYKIRTHVCLKILVITFALQWCCTEALQCPQELDKDNNEMHKRDQNNLVLFSINILPIATKLEASSVNTWTTCFTPISPTMLSSNSYIFSIFYHITSINKLKKNVPLGLLTITLVSDLYFPIRPTITHQCASHFFLTPLYFSKYVWTLSTVVFQIGNPYLMTRRRLKIITMLSNGI